MEKLNDDLKGTGAEEHDGKGIRGSLRVMLFHLREFKQREAVSSNRGGEALRREREVVPFGIRVQRRHPREISE